MRGLERNRELDEEPGSHSSEGESDVKKKGEKRKLTHTVSGRAKAPSS